MGYLIGYDVGTTSCKAAIITTQGQKVASAEESYSTYYPKPQWAEQDPDDWWKAIVLTTKSLLDKSHIQPSEILGIGFSSTMTNVILLDNDGKQLMPCIYWLDGRAGEQARRIMRRFGGRTVFTLFLGSVITGKDVLPKYFWVKENEPDIFRNISTILDSSGYLMFRATGKLICEWSEASGTGLFDVKKKKFDQFGLRIFGLLEELLPPLVRSIDQVGGLTKSAANELGLLEGTPVFPGAGDPMIAAVGSGTVGEAQAYLNLGTSAAIGVITAKHSKGKRGIVTLQSADPDKLLLYGETATAGACLKWAVQELYQQKPERKSFAQMDQEVDEAEPGSEDLIFTPWLYGERCPVPDERLRGGFLNLGLRHKRNHLARAIYEGVAFNLKWTLEEIQTRYGFSCQSLRVIGGGGRGLPWLRIIADITGRTLEVVPDPQERLSVGAGLIAAVGLGIYPSFEALKDAVPVEMKIDPDFNHQDVYQRNFLAYQEVYRSLRKFYRRFNQAET
jgi:xylulokinase